MGKYFTATRERHRQLGAIGRSHALARTAITEVFKLNGGVQGLWRWMQKSDANESAFYTVLLPKLLPAELQEQAQHSALQVVILPAQSLPNQVPSNPKHIPAPDEVGGLQPQPGVAVREPEA